MGHRDFPDHLDRLVFLDQRDTEVFLGQWAQKVKTESREKVDLLVERDLQDLLVRRATEVIKATEDKTVAKVPRDCVVMMVSQEQLDPQDHSDLQGHQASLEFQALRETKEVQEVLVHRDYPVPEVQMDSQEILDHQASLELQELTE